MPDTFRIIIGWLCVISLALQSGCTHAPPPYLPEEVRAQLGTIGIVPVKFRPETELNVPAKGWLAGAGRKSARWAGQGATVPLQGAPGNDSTGFGGLLIIALSVTAGTIGGLAGGVAGAFQAEPSEKVESAEGVITTVIASLNMQETLCGLVERIAQNRTGDKIVLVQDQGPASPEERKSYGALAGKGIDTVLEIAIPRLALAGDWDINPPLQFQMNLHYRLVRTADGKELYDSSICYQGRTLTFYGWADNDAQSFFEELDKAYQSMAEKIAGEVFLSTPLPWS